MAGMTSRERVRAALSHREPDRVPLDIGGSNVTTLVDNAYWRLKRRLDIDAPTRYLSRRAREVKLDEAAFRYLGSDTRPIWLGLPDGRPDVYHPDGLIGDEWKVVWGSVGGHYIPIGCPLASATADDLPRFAWPEPDDPGRTRGLADWARRLQQQTPYAVVLSLPVGVLHQCQYLRGYERFLVDLVADPAFAGLLMDYVIDVWLAIVSAALELVGPYVDVVLYGDDLAFQDRLMVHPRLYRALFKPRHRRIVEAVKARTDAALLFHSCGAVYPLIPDLIDIGVDGLNPVQVSAAGMGDTARLKREFGDRICFWGGIDTQQVLRVGAPAEVRSEVRRRVADLSRDGGYVVAAVHNIQEDVPLENLLAMAAAVRESG
jgi:uroporphyrinogen decarboxylase